MYSRDTGRGNSREGGGPVATASAQRWACRAPPVAKRGVGASASTTADADGDGAVSEAELRAQGAILALDRIVSEIPMLITPQVAKILRLLLHPAAVGAQGDSDVADAARQARHSPGCASPKAGRAALARSCAGRARSSQVASAPPLPPVD